MSSSAKFAFIFNPTADRKRAARALEWLQSSVKKHFPESEIFVSEKAGHATELAQNASKSFDAVIACGGDGTVQEVASGLIASGGTLGIIPMGSGNDFVKSAGISGNRNKAMLQLKNAVAKPLDVISYRANETTGVCINTLGFGFDGLINYESQKIKGIKGPLVYLLAVLRSVRKMRPSKMRMITDGVIHETQLLLLTLANGTTEGGNFKIAPDADISDGLIHVVHIQPVSKIGLLLRLGLFAIGQQHRSSKIFTTTCKEIVIESEVGLPVHADGEHIGLEIKRLEGRIMSGVIRLLG